MRYLKKLKSYNFYSWLIFYKFDNISLQDNDVGLVRQQQQQQQQLQVGQPKLSSGQPGQPIGGQQLNRTAPTGSMLQKLLSEPSQP